MKRAGRELAIAGLVLGLTAPATAQQPPDLEYRPAIESPAYRAGQGPRVVIDAAHLNFHTAESSYAPFADLLRRDGYRVESNPDLFTPEMLARADILVIANAMHPQSRTEWAPLPSLPAFTEAEIGAVQRWVREGGSLLLIADHMPLAGHAEGLAAAFGVRFHNGFAVDSSQQGRITFRRSDGSLTDSTVANGRNPGERVDFVTTFMGQAFRLDPTADAEPVLVLPEGYTLLLPEVAFQFTDSTPRIPAAYLLQGAVLRHGEGRVAVFGEAAMFSAQLAGPDKVPIGMNSPEARQNYRFALNLMHWLSGVP